VPRQVIRIDIFISSPSDLAEERQIIRRVIEKLNRGPLRDRYFLVPSLYEDEVPPQIGKDAQLIVDRFMQVQNSYILVSMFWARMGTPFNIIETAEHYESGTQYEILKGYEHYCKHGLPHILLYKKEKESPGADPAQKEKVERFFEQFFGDPPELKGLFEKYSQPCEFEAKVEAHLTKLIQTNPPKMDRRIFVELPEFKEEARRIDAAMPRQTAIGEPTPVQVLLCLPNSKGLPVLLAENTGRKYEIENRGVRAGGLTIAFPVEKATGRAGPAFVTVEIEANDFRVARNSMRVQLTPCRDSGLMSFSLLPIHSRKYSTVIVRLRCTALDGSELECGSVVLYTVVKPTKSQMSSQPVWEVVSRILTTSSLSDKVTEADTKAVRKKRILRKKALIILSRCPIYSRVPDGTDRPMLAETSEIGNVEVSGRVVIEGAPFVVYPLQLDRRIDLSGSMRYGWIKVEGRSMNASLPIPIEQGDYLLFCDRQVVLNDMVAVEIDDETGAGSKVILKRYRKSQLVSESTEEYPPIQITDQTKIIGRVVAVAKRDNEDSRPVDQDGDQDEGLF